MGVDSSANRHYCTEDIGSAHNYCRSASDLCPELDLMRSISVLDELKVQVRAMCSGESRH